MTNEEIKIKLKEAGIKNMKEFGYPDVTIESIMTDEVYSQFFESMLRDNLGNGKSIDLAIYELINELKK